MTKDDIRISLVKPFPNLRLGAFIATEASEDYEVVIGDPNIFIRSQRKSVNKHALFNRLTHQNGEYNKFCVMNFDTVASKEFREFLKEKGLLVYGELRRLNLVEFWWQINLHDLLLLLPEFNSKFPDETDKLVEAIDRVVDLIINKPNFFTNLLGKYVDFLNKRK